MASNEVNIILKATDKASGTVNKVESSFSKLNRGFKDLTGLSLGAAGGIALIGTAIQKAGKFVADSVNGWQDYTQAVKKMSLATGTGVEEMSRIIQVADDWGVQQGELQTALTMMNKNGIKPSVENLAKLADEYKNTSDKQAYAAELTKIFGRNYAALIPLLAQGGDAIREGADAIAKNLIVTDKAVKESEDYRKAVDELGDAWTGVKNTIGSAVLPVLTDLLQTTADVTGAIQKEEDVTAEYKRLLKMGLVPEIQTQIALMDEYGNIMGEASGGTEDMKKAVEAYRKEQESANQIDNVRATRVLPEVTDATENLEIATQNAAMAIVDLTNKSIGALAIEALNKAFEDGALSEKDYQTEMTNVMQRMLGMGTTSVEAEIQLNLLKKQLDSGEISASQYAKAIMDLQNKLNNLNGTTATTHVYNYTDNYVSTSRNPVKSHNGADFIVPPGYSNDSFPLGFAESGERVIVIPKGQMGNTTNNFNMNVHTNASTSTMTRDFNMMRAWGG